MARILVQTESGRLVDCVDIADDVGPYAVARLLTGYNQPLLGRLGRALADARTIEAGGDPERPSEKAMRLADAALERTKLIALVEESFKGDDCRCSPFAYTKRKHLPECAAGKALAQRIAAEDDPRGTRDG